MRPAAICNFLAKVLRPLLISSARIVASPMGVSATTRPVSRCKAKCKCHPSSHGSYLRGLKSSCGLPLMSPAAMRLALARLQPGQLSAKLSGPFVPQQHAERHVQCETSHRKRLEAADSTRMHLPLARRLADESSQRPACFSSRPAEVRSTR